MRWCVNEGLMIGWSSDMLGLEVVSGMKQEYEEWGRAKSGRKCEQGMKMKCRFYGKARPENLH